MIARLESLAHRLLQPFGFDLKRFSPANDPHLRRAALLRAEGIERVVDVGANRGQYAQTLRRYGYGGSLLSLEPTAEAFALLEAASARDAAWEVRQVALGAEPGEVSMLVSENSVSSSMLQPTGALLEAIPGSREVSQQRCPLLRLDDLGLFAPEPGQANGSEQASAGAGRPASAPATLLKLDVQGAEGQVLEGGPAALAQVQLVEIELALVPLYEGQSSFEQLIERLGQAGLRLVSVATNTIDPQSGRTLEVDAVFGRPMP